MVKKQLLVLSFLCLLTVALACGCMSATEKKLEEAAAVMESATEKMAEIEDLEWNRENRVYIKSQLAGAEADIDEALKILRTVEPANEEERGTIDAYTVVCTAVRDLCNLLRTELADGIDHLSRAEDYAADNNIAGARAELRLARSDLLDAQTRLLKIEQSIDSISASDLPVEERGELASIKVTIDEFIDMLDESIDMLDSIG